MSAALIGALREVLAQQPVPLVIEYDAAGESRICPAATLWSGGRAVAEHLRASGYGPGHRVGFTGQAGIAWIWAMIGCLREGCVFQPLSPYWTVPILAERLRQSPPHVVLDADGVLTPFAPAAPREATAVRWIVWGREGRFPRAIGRTSLEALIEAAPRVATIDIAHPPIRAVLDDGMDAESSVDLLLALFARAEVHVAPMPESSTDASMPAPDQPAS